MAKKVVAGYREKGNSNAFTKIITAVKNENGYYTYKTDIVPTPDVKTFIKENKKK